MKTIRNVVVNHRRKGSDSQEMLGVKEMKIFVSMESKGHASFITHGLVNIGDEIEIGAGEKTIFKGTVKSVNMTSESDLLSTKVECDSDE